MVRRGLKVGERRRLRHLKKCNTVQAISIAMSLKVLIFKFLQKNKTNLITFNMAIEIACTIQYDSRKIQDICLSET